MYQLCLITYACAVSFESDNPTSSPTLQCVRDAALKVFNRSSSYAVRNDFVLLWAALRVCPYVKRLLLNHFLTCANVWVAKSRPETIPLRQMLNLPLFRVSTNFTAETVTGSLSSQLIAQCTRSDFWHSQFAY